MQVVAKLIASEVGSAIQARKSRAITASFTRASSLTKFLAVALIFK